MIALILVSMAIKAAVVLAVIEWHESGADPYTIALTAAGISGAIDLLVWVS